MSRQPRSLLFVPADSARKIDKALRGEADVMLLDLEDSVAPANKARARDAAREAIAAARRDAALARRRIFVRINALDSGLADADLDAVMQAGPEAILLPKCASGRDVQQLGAKLAVREAENALPDGATCILALATETAASLFNLGTYAGASRRLRGLTWGAEDLSADVGSLTARREGGGYTAPYQLARSLTLFGAAAAEVAAIDTVFPAFRDHQGFMAECLAAARDGFVGKLAIHPDQVAAINEIFTPSSTEIARARAVVAAFAAESGAGVLAIDGEMVDRPHLRRAERLLARLW